MAGVSVPFQSSETGNEDKEGRGTEENLLLQKLLEQNRLLEEDHKFLSYNFRTGSTSDSTSMHSADSLSSLRNSTPSHDHKPTLSPIASSEPRLSDSPLLHSPTEVRSKPLPTTSYEYHYEDTESEEEEEEEGLGPGACILLDDEFETRINYDEVLPVGGIPQSPEVGVSNYGHMEGGIDDVIRTGSSTRVLKKASTVTSTSDVTLDLRDLEEGYKEEKDEPSLITGRRFRSDTESAVGSKRISLSAIVGNRKRTMTVIEGGGGVNAIKEEPEVKGQGEPVPQRTAEEELWHTWSELLRNWEESYKKKMPIIKQLARQGIPDPLRGMAWQLLSNSHNPELKEQYPALITEESPFERAIQRDLNRTFPEHDFFKESSGLGQEGLMNILKAYSIFDREVGYCQGSPFITGLLLMKMPEEEAFCVFVSLMKKYRLRDLFKPSMADLSLCFHLLEKCLQDNFPDLYMHFKAVGFQTSMYASPWFLTMFGSVLSLNVVFRIMDIFLLEGREIIFRVGLALIEANHDRLLRGDLEDILKYFQKEMKGAHEADPNALIQRALNFKLSGKKLKKLEKEFVARREKEAQEGKEIARLQAESTALAQRVTALEKECASLADRLIQGQVTLAQDAEEKFILKKKLSVAERKLAEKPDPSVTVESELVELVEGVKEGDNGLPDEHYILVKTPVHVCREEAEQVLRQLGGHSPGTSPPGAADTCTSFPTTQPVAVVKDISEREKTLAGEIPLGTYPQELDFADLVSSKEKKSFKLKKRLSNKFSHKVEQKYKTAKDGDTKTTNESLALMSPDIIEGNSPAPSPASNRKAHRRKKSKSLSGDLTFELAKVKLQCAETAHALEGKNLELKKALNREEFVVSELKTAREHIMGLEQKLFELNTCPQCGHVLMKDKLNFDLTDSPRKQEAPPTKDADSASETQVILESLTPTSDGGGGNSDVTESDTG